MSERTAGGGDVGRSEETDLYAGLFGTGVDCREAVHQLYHYLDGELTDENRQRIAEHLDYCHSCADAAGFEAELRQVIANHCRDHVPDSLRARIAAAIEDEGHQADRAGSG